MKIGFKEWLLSLTCLVATFSAFAQERITQKSKSTQDLQSEEVSSIQPTQPIQPTQSTQPVSGAVTPIYIPNESHGEVIIAGGIAGVHTRDSQMQVTSGEIDTLAQTNSYRWDNATGQLGLGYVYYTVNGPRITEEFRWFPTIEPMLNLYYSNLDIKGDVYRFKDVLLNDVNYKTNIKNARLLLDVALTIFSKCQYSVYGLLGIGEGWSRINYRDKEGGVTRINLDTDTENNIVWEWGAGASYAFSNYANVSLEYVWTDLGRMHTSSVGAINNNIIVAPQLIGANFQVATQAIMLGFHIALR